MTIARLSVVDYRWLGERWRRQYLIAFNHILSFPLGICDHECVLVQGVDLEVLLAEHFNDFSMSAQAIE